MWSFGSLETLGRDIRFGLRLLVRAPGFTTAVALTLALGVGANTAIFTLINTVMLNNLPVERPSELVLFSDDPSTGKITGNPPGLWWELSSPSYEYFRNHDEVFNGLAAVQYGRFRMSTGVDGVTGLDRTLGQLVSGNYFAVLGVKPVVGRMVGPDDDHPGAPPVAVINYAYWERKFGRDPSTVGKTVLLNDIQVEIVGVAPREFFGERVTNPPDYWLPISLQPEITLAGESYLNDTNTYWLNLIGRLKPGVSIEQAQSAMNVQLRQFVAGRLADQLPSEDRLKHIDEQRVHLVPGGKGISELRLRYSELFKILMGLVLLVLLIACINVANMLLARATAREKEITMRMALGAGRGRLIRQLLTESMLIAVLGGAIGLVAAHWLVRLLIATIKLRGYPLDFSLDARILLFALAACLTTGFLFGLVPALKATGTRLVPSTNIASAGKYSRFGLGGVLVTGQVAISLLLVVAAGLFVRTLVNLENRDLGFNRENVLVVNFDPRLGGYKEEQLAPLYQKVLDRAAALRGVKSATLAYYSPLSGSASTGNMTIIGYDPPPGQHLDFEFVSVGPDYFETLGMRILSGRGITAQDMGAAIPVAVLNATAANNLFPKESPIGHRMYSGSGGPGDLPVYEVVGVAADAVFESLRKPSGNMIFTAAILPGNKASFGQELELRTLGDPRSVAKDVRAAIAEIGPNLPVTRIDTLDNFVSQSSSEARTIAQLAAALGILALLLASVGIYGVMAYGVQRRTKEIGIRIAIGADRGALLWMVMREALTMVVVGLVIGIPGSMLVNRLAESTLYGVSASDPITLALAISMLIAAAALAAYVPARRATRVDPMTALRYE
jgi:predicted permease